MDLETSVLKRASGLYGSFWMRWILCGFPYIVPGSLTRDITGRFRVSIKEIWLQNTGFNMFRYGDAVMISHHLPWPSQIADTRVTINVIVT